jgi:hypothetical protein
MQKVHKVPMLAIQAEAVTLCRKRISRKIKWSNTGLAILSGTDRR